MADVLRTQSQGRVLVSPSDSLLARCSGDVCLSVGGIICGILVSVVVDVCVYPCVCECVMLGGDMQVCVGV